MKKIEIKLRDIYDKILRKAIHSLKLTVTGVLRTFRPRDKDMYINIV